MTPAVGNFFHTAPGTTGTDVPQVPLGEEQIPHQQDQYTNKIRLCEHHHPGLPGAPQGPITVSHDCLALAVGINQDQQVQLLLKWLLGRTIAPAKTINTLTSIDLVDTPIQPFQDLLKAPFLSSTNV